MRGRYGHSYGRNLRETHSKLALDSVGASFLPSTLLLALTMELPYTDAPSILKLSSDQGKDDRG